MQFVPRGYLKLADAVARATLALAPHEAKAFAECAGELRYLQAIESLAIIDMGQRTVPGSTSDPPYRMTEEEVARLATLRGVRDRYERARTTVATQLQHALYERQLRSFTHGRTDTMEEIPAGRWGTPAGWDALLLGGVPEANGRVSRVKGECVLVREDAFAAWLSRSQAPVAAMADGGPAELFSKPVATDLGENSPRLAPSQAYGEVVAYLRGLAEANPQNPTHTARQLWNEIKCSPRWQGLVRFEAYEDARREAFADYPNWTRSGIRRRTKK